MDRIWERIVTALVSKVSPGVVVLSGIYVFASASAESVRTSELTEFRRLTEQWVALQREIAEEESSWRDARQGWERESSLLKLQQESLHQEIVRHRHESRDFVEKYQQLIERRDLLKKRLDSCREVLAEAEVNLLTWKNRIFPALAKHLEPYFLKAQPTGTLSLPERAENIFALATEIEQASGDIHAIENLIPVGSGPRRLVHSIFFGLAQGFSYSPDELRAWSGYPVGKGWVWIENEEVAPSVRQAWTNLAEEGSSGYLVFPLKVGLESSGEKR